MVGESVAGCDGGEPGTGVGEFGKKVAEKGEEGLGEEGSGEVMRGIGVKGKAGN